MLIIKKYLLIPLMLTLASFIVHDSCEDVICLFPGNGFPLGYYYNNNFTILFFVIDFIIFLILYFFILKIIKILKK